MNINRRALFLGIDLGTSGARAIIIDSDDNIHASAQSNLSDFGANHRDPELWWQVCFDALRNAIAQVSAEDIKAISVDATSGSVLSIDKHGNPTSDGLMYNDRCPNIEYLDAILAHSPRGSVTRSGSGGLSCMLSLQTGQTAKLIHQADWINFCLSGRLFSDANNALKSGYDASLGCWPTWLSRTGLNNDLLPEVVAPGVSMGTIKASLSNRLRLNPNVQIISGTTDGCASFIATGACEVGDAVTVLGTTLTIKILSDSEISAPELGIYSHRIFGKWLAGGASNSGGGALLKYFTIEQIKKLSKHIDPMMRTGLDFYPLPKSGERFPINDPNYPSKVEPRPQCDTEFLKALLEGISNIESMGYIKIQSLGGPSIKSLYTVGSGAKNVKWTSIRQQHLAVCFASPKSQEAAFGAALLAKRGSGDD